MLYLLDANTLIHAKNEYYPLGRVDEYWSWLVHQGEQGNVKIPLEIYEEFADTRNGNGEQDELAAWAASDHVKKALLLDEEVNQERLWQVIYDGYTAAPTDADISKMGKDPFLIAYALNDIRNRCVVTGEVPAPRKQGSNRKVPDVCDQFEIPWIKKHIIIRDLNFTTSWRDAL